MNRCEVWRITHRIFTYLNEFTVVSTLGWPNKILNFDKSIWQFWQMCFTILHITHRIFTYLNEFVLVSTWRVGGASVPSGYSYSVGLTSYTHRSIQWWGQFQIVFIVAINMDGKLSGKKPYSVRVHGLLPILYNQVLSVNYL